jgi:hypothetical protein
MRCLAETGSARKLDTKTNIAFGKTVIAWGEAEWAAMQTVQVADSTAFEC